MVERRSLRLVACDCDCADRCPQGRTGIETRCQILRGDKAEPRTTYVQCGSRTVVIGEHREQVYLSLDGGIFCEPAAALTIAAALIEAAARAVEAQFRRQLGSP